MTPSASAVTALASTHPFLEDVLAGLSQPQKQLPCKYLYDELGSLLFNAICATPEYYVTRTELGILQQHMDEIVALIGPDSDILEFGSGAGEKIQLLLSRLPQVRSYCPIDISIEILHHSSAQLRRKYPHIRIYPICADYMAQVTLPTPLHISVGQRLVFFPGSTISNFTPEEAKAFLARLKKLAGPDGAILMGVDLLKPIEVLHAAYNDAAGVTAAFNKNLLARINRECGANFQLEQFSHQAHFNHEQQRIEMHLVSLCQQQVLLGAQEFTLMAGESIHTENSYKYSLEQFAQLALESGLEPRHVWHDPQHLFSVHWLHATA